MERNWKSGEEFTALDNKNYKLDDGMCVISDDKGVLGLGGIIGASTISIDFLFNFALSLDISANFQASWFFLLNLIFDG